MRTIALRFAENIAPECGTIEAHNQLIGQYGEVWYGKFGTPLSKKVIEDVLKNGSPKILLIHSGSTNRYWAYINKISKETPDLNRIPKYYHQEIGRIKTWFSVYRFEKADNYIMSKCKVASSGVLLSHASKYSMSPYFIIDYEE